MKVLFISEYISAKGQGAYMVSKAHYQSFCDIFGKKNVKVISIRTSDVPEENDSFSNINGYENRKDRLINLLCGYPPFYSKKIDSYILDDVKFNKYDLIYFDNCCYGGIIKKIKKYAPNLPIWVFFHGIYSNAGRQTIRSSHYKLQVVLANINYINQERLAVKYCDKCIVLNDRDNVELIKYYKRSADMFLPVYYKDTAKINTVSLDQDEFRILFVGGKFWPNILGITWFVENVMPKLNKRAKLYIVGRGMEYLQEEELFNKTKNVTVVGGVENLDYWYNSANITVGPIFHGDGMKTKTAEALMYGKKFIGTTEALCGYIGLDDCCCNTAEEFITTINKLVKEDRKLYYPEMRKLYEDNYSVASSNKKIKVLLKTLENKNEE